MRPVVLTISDIVKMIKGRRLNKDDSRIAFTGETGVGKSTLVGKILFRFDDFDPWKHQVYNREDVIKLLTTQKGGICWDDEAINSSYVRAFQNSDQHDLIRILTAYRSNLNLYCSTLPQFFTIDKHIRDLFFMHIHVIARGIAVVHMRNAWSLYSKDKWGTDENSKIEKKWIQKKIKNPLFKPPYHRLSTFRGYLYFEDLTPKQRELIEKVKEVKRAEAFVNNKQPNEMSFVDKVYKSLTEGKLNKDSLQSLCQFEGKKYSSICVTLNRMLKDSGEPRTVKSFFELSFDKKRSEIDYDISKNVPNFS